MQIQKNISLQDYNTFASQAKYFATISSSEDLGSATNVRLFESIKTFSPLLVSPQASKNLFVGTQTKAVLKIKYLLFEYLMFF